MSDRLNRNRNIKSWTLEGHNIFSLSNAVHCIRIYNLNTHSWLASTVEGLHEGIFGVYHEISDVFVGLAGLDHESSDFVSCSLARDGHFQIVSGPDCIPAQFDVVRSWGGLGIGPVLRYHVLAGIFRGSCRIAQGWSYKTHGEEKEHEFESHPRKYIVKLIDFFLIVRVIIYYVVFFKSINEVIELIGSA